MFFFFLFAETTFQKTKLLRNEKGSSLTYLKYVYTNTGRLRCVSDALIPAVHVLC